ncbi:MAG: hypothetical protein ACI9AD_001070 [Nitriliruptoraceae bacterium]|jgi:uncharacterized protein YcnI
MGLDTGLDAGAPLRVSILLIAATTAALTLVAAPAFAHTTVTPSTTVAGAYAVIDMRVPHGCECVATAVLDVPIPAGVVLVKPEQVPGWTVTTETGTYDEPVIMHGQELTEGVVSVTWTADDGGEIPAGTSGVTWAALVLSLLGLGLGGAAFAKAGTTATPGAI